MRLRSGFVTRESLSKIPNDLYTIAWSGHISPYVVRATFINRRQVDARYDFCGISHITFYMLFDRDIVTEQFRKLAIEHDLVFWYHSGPAFDDYE